MLSSFYGKIYSENYDTGTDIQELTNFYIDHWRRLGRPNPVLEPMCGTGLNLIPFLQAGAKIDGLDSSPHMLAVCRRKLDAQGLTADLYEQPIEQMTLPQQYGFIFIPGGSFGHMHKLAEAQACLERILAQLRPGGWFMVDARPPSYLSNFGQPGEASFEVKDLVDGSILFSTGIWGNVEDSRVIRHWNKYERYVNGKLIETEVFDYRERMYERDEMESLLTAAGFQNVSIIEIDEAKEAVMHKGATFVARKL